MNAVPEDFQKLQKLLAMKRHEQPPPTFFVDFSDQVLHRLNTPAETEPSTWWQRMGLDFDLKPALICAWGVVLCGSLAAGMIVSTRMPETGLIAASPSPFSVTRLGVSGSASSSPAFTSSASTVAPALSPVSQFTLRSQPAGFSLGM